MKTFYVNARYLIVPLMTVATILGIFIGNNFVWLGVILFGFNTIIDTLTKDIHFSLLAQLQDHLRAPNQGGG